MQFTKQWNSTSYSSMSLCKAAAEIGIAFDQAINLNKPLERRFKHMFILLP